MTDTLPPDAADHAEESSHRWVDRLENAVEGRMHALEIPEEQIGASDHERGVAWRTFFPDERESGGVSTGDRLNVDSGVLNPEQMAELGPTASGGWEHARLRDRIDVTIAHEYEEAKGCSHEYAYEHAPETSLRIGEPARGLLRAIRDGERGRATWRGDSSLPR